MVLLTRFLSKTFKSKVMCTPTTCKKKKGTETEIIGKLLQKFSREQNAK